MNYVIVDVASIKEGNSEIAFHDPFALLDPEYNFDGEFIFNDNMHVFYFYFLSFIQYMLFLHVV